MSSSRLGKNILKNNNLSKEERIKLFNDHIRMVPYMINRLKINKSSPSYDDLLQEGYIGLIRATELFIPEYGNKFSTYAIWWIKSKITRHLSAINKNYKFPIDSTEDYFLTSLLSLDSTIISEKEGKEFIINDVIGYDPTQILYQDIDKNIEINNVFNKINEIFIDLSNNERYEEAWRYALILKYRILSCDPIKLDELGSIIKISRERVRQIENELFDKIYHKVLYVSNNLEKNVKKRKKSPFGISSK